MGRRLTSEDVLDLLRELFIARGLPKSLRSDNGSEFTAPRVRKWLQSLGARTLLIASGSPWENGYLESFTGKLRDELLNGEIFDTPAQAACLPPGLASA